MRPGSDDDGPVTDTTTPRPQTAAYPTLADIEAARKTIAGVARVTPMETSQFLAELLGSPVHLKCENLQRTGAYKVRGAYNRLSTLSPEQRAAGVVAASAGNHAQGVALAARELGIPATIFTRSASPCRSCRRPGTTAPRSSSADTPSRRRSSPRRTSPPGPAPCSSRRSTTPP